MEDFEILDDYIRYPIKEGEAPIFETMTYETMLKIHRYTIDYWKKEDKAWFDRVSERLNLLNSCK